MKKENGINVEALNRGETDALKVVNVRESITEGGRDLR